MGVKYIIKRIKKLFLKKIKSMLENIKINYNFKRLKNIIKELTKIENKKKKLLTQNTEKNV